MCRQGRSCASLSQGMLRRPSSLESLHDSGRGPQDVGFVVKLVFEVFGPIAHPSRYLLSIGAGGPHRAANLVELLMATFARLNIAEEFCLCGVYIFRRRVGRVDARLSLGAFIAWLFFVLVADRV